MYASGILHVAILVIGYESGPLTSGRLWRTDPSARILEDFNAALLIFRASNLEVRETVNRQMVEIWSES